MAQKVILFVLFVFVLFCPPAWAESYECWIEEDLPPELAFGYAEGEEGVAPEEVTTDSSIMLLSSYSTYDNTGLLSDQYLTWARGLLQYVKVNEDYVLARTGQYQYIFAVGDFSDGFSGVANVYRLTVGNNNYQFSVASDSSFSLNTRGQLVYSSVPPFPSLTGSDFSYGLLFFVVFVFLLVCVSRLFRVAFRGWFD